MIERIEPGARLSRASVHNGVAYLCGVVAPASPEIRAQTEGCLQEIDRLLGLAGSSKSKVLHVMVHVKDFEYDAVVNEVYDNWIDPGTPPSRTSVIAQPRRPEALVEMTVVAAV